MSRADTFPAAATMSASAPASAGDSPIPASASGRPTVEIARGFSSRPVALGFGVLFELRGGDRLGPDGIVADLAMDWQPGLMRLVAHSCEDLRIGGCGWFTMPPTLLAGPPGVGRTHIARRVAAAAGVPHFEIDASDTGLFASAAPPDVRLPLPPLVGMALTLCANPVVSIRNVDRANALAAAVIGRLVDTRANRRFVDEAVGATLDLGAVTWLVHAPDVQAVPDGVRRSLVHLDLERPGPEARRLLAVDLAAEVTADFGLPPPDGALVDEMVGMITRIRSAETVGGLHGQVVRWLQDRAGD